MRTTCAQPGARGSRRSAGRSGSGWARLSMGCLVATLAWLAWPAASAGPEPVRGPSGAAAVRASAARIDELVAAYLRARHAEPARPCADAVFVRRAFLDLIGTLPEAPEVRAFLEDPDPGKRGALVDRLLERDEFADYWAMKWCNLLRVKSEFPINLWPNAVQAYHRWIRTSLKENLPYDRFARELLTSSGSSVRVPQVNFFRAVQGRSPQTLAQAVALTFMGARAEMWLPERRDGMAAFFARVGYKTTAEWKEEIVFDDLGRVDAPASAAFPDGSPAPLSALEDPRVLFADWLLTPKNPWFTRSIANRVWSWMLGTGIVQEPDDLRPDNPPAHAGLLDLLELELRSAHYDLKHLFRLILASRTWQADTAPASGDAQAAVSFATYRVRRLEAEVLIDAINQVTGSTETYTSRIPEPYTFMPEAQRAIALADASITSPFLDLFGRSPRDTGLESEQGAEQPTASQRLHLLNSSHIRSKLEQGPRIRALLRSTGRPQDLVDELYLAILSRHPTPEDLAVLVDYRKSAGGRRGVGLDLAWALLNSAEFQYRH